MLNRRRFLGTVSASLLAAPLVGEAQPAGKIPVIGLLDATTPSARADLVSAFRQGLREFGYVEQGVAPWFETALYLFTSIQPDQGWDFVGTHLRPRVRIPESWQWRRSV